MTELRPQGLGEIEFRVHGLPHEEAREPLLTGGADHEVGVRLAGRVEVLGDVVDVEQARDLLERRPLLRVLLEQCAYGVGDLAANLTPEQIGEHLYTGGQPDPDLVIRTSGEQRLGGFLLWQSAHSEFYFCEAYWPDFRHVDFLRALRDYAQRERRLGR